jgi:hypothetical protein
MIMQITIHMSGVLVVYWVWVSNFGSILVWVWVVSKSIANFEKVNLKKKFF